MMPRPSAWLIAFVGEVGRRGIEHNRSEWGQDQGEPVSGTHTLTEHVIRLPATASLPAHFIEGLAAFDMARLEAFDPRRLAGLALAGLRRLTRGRGAHGAIARDR